jgi:aminomethyltransferase
MAGRRSARCLSKCIRLAPDVVSSIKPRADSSRPFSTTVKLSRQGIFGATAIRTPVSVPDLQCRTGSAPASRRRFASQTEHDVKKTPLYDLHVSKKAKFIPFGGYSMPLYYDDLNHAESHHWTREKASIFDVSHMYGAVLLSTVLGLI